MREAASGDAGGMLSATADVLSAFLALAVVVGLPLSIGNDLLGSPLSATMVSQVVFVFALGAAYPFVAGDWPLAKLTDFALAAVLAAFALSGLVGVALLATGGGLPTDSLLSTAVTVGVLGVSFAAAAGYVRRRERSHRAGAGGDASEH